MSEDTQDDCILTIKQIKDKVTKGEIELPPIQRGFVWKPYQIENLWDSLLRGFPIGCFICKKNSDGVIEILDGQQRLTSILIGFNWDSVEENTYVSKIKEIKKDLKIFLDLEENSRDEKDYRKYNTRVITKSHPWGYRRSPNKEILSYADIRQAKDIIMPGLDNQKIYISNELQKKIFNKAFPYDSKSKEECIPIENIMLGQKIDFKYQDEKKESPDFLTNILKTKIPFLFIEEETKDTKFLKISEHKELPYLDSTEYLFTLINSGGTRVSNDDLNFSLIKSQLMKNSQGAQNGRKFIYDIEDKCNQIGIEPSRFVMICYYLWKVENSESVSLYIQPTQFRYNMKDEDTQKKFLFFLKNQIDENLLLKAQNLLIYSDTNQKGIPYIWFLDIIQQNMYLTFLMCYLLEQKEKIIDIETSIISLITILYIFGYHKNRQQTQKKLVTGLVTKIKEQIKLYEKINITELSYNFFQEDKYRQLMTKPLDPKVIDYTNKDFFNGYETDNYKFGNYIKWEKELLLYAQRKFLSEEFEKEQFALDDMNRPFDYDHIFPAKYYERNVCENWNTIGNFRAWPYYMNRSDSDDTPAIKFKVNDSYDNNLLKQSFCYEKNEADDKYKYFTNMFTNIGDKEKLKKNENEEKGKAEEVIRKRILLIYKEWYETLNISAFFENNENPQ